MISALSSGNRGGEALWWIALQQVPGVGAATMLRLARIFGSPQKATEASVADLVSRGGLNLEQASRVASLPETIPSLEAKLQTWRDQGIEVITIEEERYPASLHVLRSIPPLLYIRGTLQANDKRAIAVVGSRDADKAGVSLARKIGREFAQREFTIVSGLARGIDTAGHRGALDVKKGRTIAILGSGLLKVYPPENAVLAQKITRRGCLLAEVPPETEVDSGLLLARDRLQAAMSQAVIVVQAHAECGSIVTAQQALRCGRLLYAVPWSKPPFSEGWERLHKMGARPIDSATDFEALACEITNADNRPHQSPLL